MRIFSLGIENKSTNRSIFQQNFKEKTSGNYVPNNSTNPAFTSTSAGAPLKNLKYITDPYFGEKMIPMNEFSKFERIIETKNTVKKAIKELNKYRGNMQLVERAIFDGFQKLAGQSPRMQFNDLLKLWYNKALIKLKLEEFVVLDEIDKMSMDLEPYTTFQVRAQTTHCRQVILDNNPMNPFKRKTVIDSIDQINPKDGEEKALNELKKLANYLPSSNTSVNAFIVKYVNRSHEEISKRLVRASVQSIEHIKPDSLGGENSLDNFMLVSSAANSLRGNMPLPDYIKMFPNILINCQKYIDDIIEVIHHGGLRGNQSYPYKVSRTLERESDGIIKLNLNKFVYSEQEAEELEKLPRIRHRKKDGHGNNRKPTFFV